MLRAAETDLSPLDQVFVTAAAPLGYPWIADLNGEPIHRPSVRPKPENVADGVRMHAAFIYLAPARPRSNLTIMPNTVVDRIFLADGHPAGVYTADGRGVGGRKVVLGVGAYGSPAILLRSGIGPAAHQ